LVASLASFTGCAILPPFFQNVPDRRALTGYEDLDGHAPFYGRVTTFDGCVREGTVLSVDEILEFRNARRGPARHVSIPVGDVMRIKIFRSWLFTALGTKVRYETVYDRSKYGEVRSCLRGIDWLDWPEQIE